MKMRFTILAACLLAAVPTAKAQEACTMPDGAPGEQTRVCHAVEPGMTIVCTYRCRPLASWPQGPDCTGPLGEGDCGQPDADDDDLEAAIDAGCVPVIEVDGEVELEC